MLATFLQTRDLLNLCFVNSRWANIGNNPITWKAKFSEAWLLFISEKPRTWTCLKWVSYISMNNILLNKVGTLFTLTEGVDSCELNIKVDP